MGQQYQPSAVRLLAEHERELIRYVLPLVRTVDEARDVFQETAMAILKKFDEYDAGKPFLPWAKRFARYEALMSARRRRRYEYQCEDLLQKLADRHDEADRQTLRRLEAIRESVARLPEADRELLRLRYADPDMTIQQLASETNQSVYCLYKALARIRKQLFEEVRDALALAEDQDY